MFELINSIPINIWSVALGSMIAFIGILISNWNHNKRLTIQLNHDSELKTIERKAVMRREVYLNAVEELVRANSYLGSLPQQDLSKNNISESLQGFFASAAKLSLVAEEETVKALNKLVLSYNALVFKLMINIKPISKQKNQIKILNKHYDETQIEIKRILAEMNRQNESGVSNEHVFNVLDSSFKFHQKRAEELSEEINMCWEKVNEHTKKFVLLLMDELKEITALQAPVIVGIRKELDIDTNLESYKDMINSSAEKIREQLDNALASLDNKD